MPSSCCREVLEDPPLVAMLCPLLVIRKAWHRALDSPLDAMCRCSRRRVRLVRAHRGHRRDGTEGSLLPGKARGRVCRTSACGWSAASHLQPLCAVRCLSGLRRRSARLHPGEQQRRRDRPMGCGGAVDNCEAGAGLSVVVPRGVPFAHAAGGSRVPIESGRRTLPPTGFRAGDGPPAGRDQRPLPRRRGRRHRARRRRLRGASSRARWRAQRVRGRQGAARDGTFPGPSRARGTQPPQLRPPARGSVLHPLRVSRRHHGCRPGRRPGCDEGHRPDVHRRRARPHRGQGRVLRARRRRTASLPRRRARTGGGLPLQPHRPADGPQAPRSAPRAATADLHQTGPAGRVPPPRGRREARRREGRVAPRRARDGVAVLPGCHGKRHRTGGARRLRRRRRSDARRDRLLPAVASPASPLRLPSGTRPRRAAGVR